MDFLEQRTAESQPRLLYKKIARNASQMQALAQFRQRFFDEAGSSVRVAHNFDLPGRLRALNKEATNAARYVYSETFQAVLGLIFSLLFDEQKARILLKWTRVSASS